VGDDEAVVGVGQRQDGVGHAQAGRLALPLKMTSSSGRRGRSSGVAAEDQSMASTRLLLPVPLGPTMAVMRGGRRSWSARRRI